MSQLTKYGVSSNIKIPPESTGPRVHHHVHFNLAVSGFTPLSGPLSWSLNSQTGATGYVTGYGSIELSVNKRLTILLDLSSPVTEIQVGDVLTIADQSEVGTCTVISVEPVYSPAVVLTGGDNPSNFLNIDRAGSAFVRFTEGEQQLDPKGATRITTATTLMEVKFLRGGNDTQAYGKSTGGGSQTHSAAERLLFMDTDASAGSSIVKRSNRYCFFQGGYSSLYESVVAVGDNGKAGVVRRWGYYDDNDGLFFELNQNQLNVVVRSSVSGTVQETRVPQSEWSVDKLDGTSTVENISGLEIDVQNMNYYFIDFPGSSAGRVRFGIYGPNGRIVCHQFYFGNNSPVSFMRSAILPVTWEQFNVGATASPSRMKTTGATVMNEGFQTPESQLTIATNYTWVAPSTVSHTGTGWKYLLGTRAALVNPLTGAPNISATIPSKLSYYVSGGPVILQIVAGLIPDGAPNFQAAAYGSVAEVDTSGTYPASPLAQGIPQLSRFYDVGHHIVDPPAGFNVRGASLTRRSDGNYGLGYTFVFKPVNPADTVSVRLALDWIDV